MDKKTIEWLLKNTREWFPSARIVSELENSVSFDCRVVMGCDFCPPGEKALGAFVHTMNKFFKEHEHPYKAEMIAFDGIPTGVNFSQFSLWNDDILNNDETYVRDLYNGFMEFTNQNFGNVLTDAVKGNIPEDFCLKQRLRLPLGCVENSPTEDGIGILGACNDHVIDFKVEGIEYIEEMDEETMEYYTTPSLWYAHGNMDGFHVSLIAGSEAHAFAKILQAFYKKANKINPEMFKAMKWRKYGYCY